MRADQAWQPGATRATRSSLLALESPLSYWKIFVKANNFFLIAKHDNWGSVVSFRALPRAWAPAGFQTASLAEASSSAPAPSCPTCVPQDSRAFLPDTCPSGHLCLSDRPISLGAGSAHACLPDLCPVLVAGVRAVLDILCPELAPGHWDWECAAFGPHVLAAQGQWDQHYLRLAAVRRCYFFKWMTAPPLAVNSCWLQ